MNEEIRAIWFSRHTPSPEQIAELRGQNVNLVVTDVATTLASRNLNDYGDVKACLTALFAECVKVGATRIYGVFATPVSNQIFRTMCDIVQRGEFSSPHGGNGDYPCYAAWSTSRAEEGQRPIFAHKAFSQVGYLSQASLRWL